MEKLSILVADILANLVIDTLLLGFLSPHPTDPGLTAGRSQESDEILVNHVFKKLVVHQSIHLFALLCKGAASLQL